jgi:Eukaryotic aspartyl protease
VGNRCNDLIKTFNTSSVRLDFVAATKDYGLDSFYADGVLGLGFSASEGAQGLVQALYDAGIIPEPVFSLYLSDNEFAGLDTNPSSGLVLGETDLKYAANEDKAIIPVFSNKISQWVMGLSGFIFQGKLSIYNTTAILDTVSTFIIGPKSEVIILQKLFLTEYGCGFENHGLIECECYDIKIFKNITFIVSGQYLDLSPTNYFYEVI